jgi:hypothetical protein
MKNVLNKLLFFFLLSTLFYSCVNSDYDIGNIDDSDGLSPALAFPVGSLNTKILDFIKGAGIEATLHGTDSDTIYVTYDGQMSLKLLQEIPGWTGDYVFYAPPGMPDIELGFDEGEGSVDIDVFKGLQSGGSMLYPSNPQIYLTIYNYIGANIEININGITSYGNSQEKHAVFNNNTSSYVINAISAPEPNQSTVTGVTFNKANGKIHELFTIAPERISYDFGVELTVPDDGSLFLVPNKFVDIDYKVKIPFTFGEGTRLANADTLDLDLSGEDFISNLDELTLWIDYENRLQTTVELDILFLDEYKNLISNIEKEFNMDAAPSSGTTPQSEAEPKKGSFTVEFKKDEVEDAQRTRYIVLKSILKTGSGEVNIHPSDYVNLKLSAYLAINI